MSEEISGLPARRAALIAFIAVLKGAAVDPAIAEAVAKNGVITQSDRGFARTLLLTLLRRGREAEARLAEFLSDASALPYRIHHLLWLGYVQLQVLDVKPHAALNTATELAKTLEGGRYAPLVNAVLRKAAALEPLPVAEQAKLNLAPWLTARWTAQYGPAITQYLAEVMLAPVPLDITVKNDAAAWAALAEGTVLPGGNVRLAGGSEVTSLPGFDAGDFWVQDAAAALPLSLLGDISGKRALDIGAAPGGKTAQLCRAEVDVTAIDISAPRMQRLRDNMDRLGYAPEIVVADARHYAPDSQFDLIICDAPCSATGTLRRHPELGWQKSAADITRLAHLQGLLLDRAVEWLAPAGELVFLTCSLEAEEGEAQLETFLSRHSDFQVIPFKDTPFGDVLASGALRILPTALAEQGGNDGFFAVRLRRI